MNLEVFMKLRLWTGRVRCQLVQAHHQPTDADLFPEIGNPKRTAYLIALAECGNKAQAARVTAPMFFPRNSAALVVEAAKASQGDKPASTRRTNSRCTE